jgi:hypothetical protein
MNIKEKVIREIEKTPDFLLAEVLDFLQFIKSKYLQDTIEISILSESSLSKDWLTPEEDEVWKDL